MLPDAPTVQPPVPQRRLPGMRLLGRLVLLALRFRIEGTIPALARQVCIVAPHTSNWDFPVGLATTFVLRLRASWLGKAELFRWPFGWMFRLLGGIPVDRSHHHGVVEQTIQAIRDADGVFLAIAPQGTRRRNSEWKLGFYHIAHGAGVPITPVSIDYARRVLSIGEPFATTGDRDADVAQLKALFEGVRGLYGSGPTGA